MTEFMQPKPDTGGFVDSVEARAALDEFKYISRMRGDAHAKANLFRDYHVSPEDSPDHPLRRKLQNLRGLLTRWALMQANQEFRTVDLARIENNGDWDATESAEVDMERLAIQEYEAGNSQGQILRNSPESKLRIMVDPTLLCANGLVVVRRKRLMLRTITTTSRFRDVRPHVEFDNADHGAMSTMLEVRMRLEVDKVSEFVLDARRLGAISIEAAEKLGAIIHGNAPVEVTGMEQEGGNCLSHVIEGAIDEHDPLLTPATTTYYADRKYSDVRRLEASVVGATDLGRHGSDVVAI